MNRDSNRWARLALACSVVAVVVGCDNSESAFLDEQSNALSVRLAGGDASAVAAELPSATSGTLPVNAQANQLLAQARLSDARASAATLMQMQAEADAIAARINSIAAIAGATETLGAGYRKAEPTAAISLIEDFAAKARGDGNVEKFTDLPSASIPTLSAVKQEKSRLEGELAKAQEQLAQHTAKRNDLLTETGTLSAKADEQRGQDKLDTVTQAAALRQQAAVESREINALEAKIVQLQADLAIQTSLESQLASAVQSFEKQQAVLKEGWQQTESKLDEQSKFASSIISAEGGDGNASVRSLAADLNARLEKIKQQREQTLGAYGDAVAKFTAAETAANGFNQSLSSLRSGGATSAQTAAWNSLASTLNVDRYNLQKCVALREQAAIHTSHARFLLHLARVASTLEGLPKSLNAPVADPFNAEALKAQAAEAVKQADELITEAKAKLDGVSATDEGLASLRPLKASTAIFVNYDRALLSQLAASAGIEAEVAKPETYTDSIEAAKAAIVEARESSVLVPNVPAEIYVEPAKPAAEEKPAEAAPAVAVNDTPAAAELRASLKELLKQSESMGSDPALVDQFFSRIKTDDASAPLIAQFREFADIGVRIEKGIRDKFGEEGVAEFKTLSQAAPGTSPLTPEAMAKAMDTVTLTEVDATTVEMPFPNAPATEAAPKLKFVKEDEVWKLDLTQLPPPIISGFNLGISMMSGMKDGMTTLANDIEGGKYATVQEVHAAMQALMPQMPAGGKEAAPATDTPTETPTETPSEGTTPTDGVAPGM